MGKNELISFTMTSDEASTTMEKSATSGRGRGGRGRGRDRGRGGGGGKNQEVRGRGNNKNTKVNDTNSQNIGNNESVHKVEEGSRQQQNRGGRYGRGRGRIDTRGRGRGKSKGTGKGRGKELANNRANGNDNDNDLGLRETFKNNENDPSNKNSNKNKRGKIKKTKDIDNYDNNESEGRSKKATKSSQINEGKKKIERNKRNKKEKQDNKNSNQPELQQRNNLEKCSNSYSKKQKNGKEARKGKQDDKQSDSHSKKETIRKETKKDKQDDKQSKSNKSNNKKVNSAFSSKPSIPPNQPQQTSDVNYGKGENITILHIGEKPSIAEAIAKGLCGQGDRNINKRVMTIHTFNNPSFPKAPHAKKVMHKVTSVAGHVFSVDFPQEYQSWESVDPAELFHAPIKRKPCKGSIVTHLQNEAKGVDFIVLWMDCDREGENINFEVLDCCMHCMRGGGGVAHYDRVYRAYFSAINPSDIIKAYNSLGKPDKNQALAVDARQELDLKVGVAFSRFQTRFFQGRYGDLDSSVLSYGPCQTPTMGFVVQRHIDIETFTPEPYWVLELGILKRGRRLRALWESGRSFNKKRTEILLENALRANAVAVVQNVVVKEKKQGRPVRKYSFVKEAKKTSAFCLRLN